MDNFTMLDGVVITVVSILVVFLVLIGLQIVISFLRLGANRKKRKYQQTKQSITAYLEEDEETKTVAALTALILANEDQQDKHYQITFIERIR